MKVLFTLFLVLFSYFASANTQLQSTKDQFSIEATLAVEFNDRGKKAKKRKARHGKRMNKKRKRACGKWGGRSYAG